MAWAARLAAQPRERTARCSEKEVKNAEREASRRRPLAGAISVEQQEVSDTEAVAAQARYGAAQASLEQARVNLERTQIRAPANGWVTNLLDVPNAQPNGPGVASVNPIFTWVRLAQRIPVRIEIDAVPDGVGLAAGMTATVEIEPRLRVDPPSSP